MVQEVKSNTEECISIDDYVDYVERFVDLRDSASVVESAAKLQQLANNKRILIESVNRSLSRIGQMNSEAMTPSTSILAKGKSKDFYVRFNIWPPAEGNGSEVARRLFSYDVVHDHNFNFLTANFFGPGYETEVWHLPKPREGGYDVNDRVDLEYQGRFRLAPKTLLWYECGSDVHLQLPPPDYSVSLNLMVSTKEMRSSPQHVFSPEAGMVSGFPEGTVASRRVQLIRMAARFNTPDTQELLARVYRSSHCRRTREAALQALEAS